MPGIFGVGAAQQGAQQGGMSALFADMATRMRHHAWYRESGYVDEKAGIALGRMALGFVNTAPQPAFNQDRSLLAVMDGEIYDYDEQRRRLIAEGRVSRPIRRGLPEPLDLDGSPG